MKPKQRISSDLSKRGGRVRVIWSVCRRKGVKYWIFGAGFAFVGWAIGHALEGVTAWLDLKYYTYVAIQDLRGGPARVPKPVLVRIGDAEFYGPELAARRPLKRDYLAKLVTAISNAKPQLIALDIDFRSPAPDSGAADLDDYLKENRVLFAALCAAQVNARIVISTAINQSGEVYTADPNIYDGNSECQIPGGRISVGHLALATDLRRIPLTVRLEDGSPVHSFSLAVARAIEPRQYPEAFEMDDPPYARFHPPDEFKQVDASTVLRGLADSDLEGRVVVVYGDWHVMARDRGELSVDSFRTPVGVTAGAFVHANLIETLLTAEYSSPSPEAVIVVVECVVALGLAIAFAFPIGLGRKFLYLAGTAGLLFVVAWLGFQVFALFFDIVPILVAMYLHAVADQVYEWREAAHATVSTASSVT
jgi:CHASE2 domain-containing sensor protein